MAVVETRVMRTVGGHGSMDTAGAESMAPEQEGGEGLLCGMWR